MNEMYDMSIVTHNYGVMSVLGVILVNVFMLLRAKSPSKYRRFVRIFNPIVGTAIGFIVFTGVIMMAAKHLEFTVENIVMIVFVTILIVLEAKRASKLKYLDTREEGVFEEYKKYALNLLKLEVLVTLSISTWMWI